MEMKICFGKNNREVKIQNIFPSERTLSFTASSNDTTYDILTELEGYSGPIKYYEDGVLKMEYNDYSGSFEILYVSGSYSVTVSQKTKLEFETESNAKYIKTTADAVEQLMAVVFGGE